MAQQRMDCQCPRSDNAPHRSADPNDAADCTNKDLFIDFYCNVLAWEATT
jgi:hypothetical protein